MAEAIVSLVVENLIPLLMQEATYLHGIHREVTDFKDELESIQSFVKEADERAEREATSDGVKIWVRQLREVAYQIEDVIDKYVLHVALQSKRCHSLRFGGFVRWALCGIASIRTRSEIASEMKQIKADLVEIKERGKDYGLISSSQPSSGRSVGSESWHDPRVASLFIEEAEVVGIDYHRDYIINYLVKGPSKRTIISVVGMGGVGKTTLVKKVFDHQIVASHFNRHAWITVSQSYKEEELLRTALKEFCRMRKESPPMEIDDMNEAMLIESLREYLMQQSYIVVFDDVWKVNFWSLIKYAMPENNQGSRVIITTRNEDVALPSKESSIDKIYKLQPLAEDKAFELFCKKVFHSDALDSCPSELKELSKNIVRRCGGLPLAIAATGGMLSTKRKIVIEWQKMEHAFGSELLTNPHLSPMTKIIGLSFYDLPYYLKLCFMYLGLMPRVYSLNAARLSRLWMAEGFVKETTEKTAEQVAYEYLTELAHRSMVQVDDVTIYGNIRMLRVPDLVREMILSKSQEWGYGTIWQNDRPNIEAKVRRVTICRSASTKVVENVGNFGIRSVLFFKLDELPSSFLSMVTSAFKLLKVLDLQEAPVDYLPENLGNLFHLRYLGMRQTKIKMLPRSIGKLHNLQTLDFKCTHIHELPAEIKRLHKLRYLLGYSYDYDAKFSMSAQSGMKIVSRIDGFLELRKFYLIEVDQGFGMIRDLSKLTQLRKLGITKLPSQSGKFLCESIASLKYLESLEICSTSEYEVLDLQFNSSPPPDLRRIYLKGHLEKVPDWILELGDLNSLSLVWSRLVVNPLEVLERLSHLLELVLQQAYNGEHLTFHANGFPKLRILKLYDMDNLSNLTIEDDALPHLEVLKIGPSPRLKSVPIGVRYLRKLIQLRFYDVPQEFALRLLPNVGEDCWIAEHVRVVLFHYQIRGERYKTYTPSDLANKFKVEK